MSQIYNVYCDESCHLEHDHQQVMVLGAIWCPAESARDVSVRIREIKALHNMKPGFEMKWTKVSPAKQRLYLDAVDYFFDDDDLCFRALIVPDKSGLRHDDYGQTHDECYYKIYFDMLKVVFNPKAKYRIYLDIKDTRSASKTQKLHDVLCNNMYDFSRSIIERVQTVRSHEMEILQLTDLLIGAISYVNRGLTTSPAKTAIIQRIRKRSSYDLTRTTLLRENKMNILRWRASEPEE